MDPSVKMKKSTCPAILLLMILSVISFGEEGQDILRVQARKGDTQSQFRLASEYFYGTDSRKQNIELALYWFRQAADGGLAEAQLNYAICLEQGFGCKADPKTALEYYRKASQEGLSPAIYNMALLLLYGSDKNGARERMVVPQPEEAKKLLSSLVLKNYAPAMVELAAIWMLMKPEELTPDLKKKSFELLKKAATLPDNTPKGWRLLADCYVGGIGTDLQPEKAIPLLKKAVEKKDLDSLPKLAFFYERGEFVKTDRQYAFRLYKEAAERGLAFAQFKYAEYIAEGFEEGAGFPVAMEWYGKSAQAKCPQALHKLGIIYRNGTGMKEPDPVKAATYFLEAANLGMPQAQYELANMFYIGDGIPRNERQAFLWFGKAALAGYTPAMRRVGQCYYEGCGCEKDNEKAVEWIHAAAEAGDYIARQMIEQNSRSGW